MLEHIAEISQNSLSEPVRCHELQDTVMAQILSF